MLLVTSPALSAAKGPRVFSDRLGNSLNRHAASMIFRLFNNDLTTERNQDTTYFPSSGYGAQPYSSVLHILQILYQARPGRLPIQRLACPLARGRHIQSRKVTEHPEVLACLCGGN